MNFFSGLDKFVIILLLISRIISTLRLDLCPLMQLIHYSKNIWPEVNYFFIKRNRWTSSCYQSDTEEAGEK